MSSNKRPLEAPQDSPSKKARSETPTNAPIDPITQAELIARKKAEVALKLAQFAAASGPKPPTRTLNPPPASAALPARPQPSSSSTPTSASSSTSKLPPGIDPDLAKKIAEAKRRADASRATIEISANPYLTSNQAGVLASTAKKSGSSTPQPIAPQSSGLKVAAHPLLLDTAPTAAVTNKKDRHKPMQPKFASIKANVRAAAPTPPPAAPVVKKETAPGANPYTSAPVPTVDTSAAPKDRERRQFRFNQKGKYVALGQQMRQEAQLEELKKRIAETARKAGLDSEFETLEKTIRREAPPEVEWWDVALLPNKTYNDIKAEVDEKPDFSKTAVRSDDSPITLYVQHPIPIPAPWDKNKVELKPLKLTKKEMKKMRKQRRMAEQQDKQDRQKMGLIPPDPPKVRLANLMRVLTSDAVQDPTKVEARVRREVAMRKQGHEQMNTERKLTDEQRREKVETKKGEEEKKGIYGAAFKIKTLSDPSHRFKVRKNAEQFGLTGVCIFNPSFNLVLVEGSAKAIKQYKRLMLVRVRWTEAARERGAPEDSAEPDEEGAVVKQEEGASHQADLGNTDLGDNTCDMVWEGPLRDRVFSGFRAKKCPNDTLARELLGEKMASYWDIAKAHVREDQL
ncbi:hypothetical protein FRB90_007192 [Tulasnella sp. 427]|nr:hypothetical protein FRB90_007192 [Tulasnella sp. 427]